MIIEFFGLPGSGKTSLCKVVSNALLMQGVDSEIADPYKKTKNFKKNQIKKFLAGSKGLKLVSIWLLLDNIALKEFSLRVFFVRLFRLYYLIGYFASESQKPASYMLVDQGVVQSAWSLVIHSGVSKRKSLECFCSILNQKLSDRHFVFVEVPINISISRFTLREQQGGNLTKLNLKSKDKKLFSLEKGVLFYEIFTNKLLDNSWSFTIVNGLDPVNVSAQDIIKVIEKSAKENNFG